MSFYVADMDDIALDMDVSGIDDMGVHGLDIHVTAPLLTWMSSLLTSMSTH